MTAQGFDVSSFQGTVDFAKAKHSGRDFVYFKATEGQDFTDPRFHANLKATAAAGIERGAYHFLRPRSDRKGAVEAEWFARAIEHADLTLRPVADIEVSTIGRLGGAADDQEGTGRMGVGYHDDPDRTVSADSAAGRALAEYVESFLDRAAKLLGERPLIYTFPAFASWSSRHSTGLWIANFGVSKPAIPGPWTSYLIWQKSSSATVAGVSGHVDVDVCPDLSKIRLAPAHPTRKQWPPHRLKRGSGPNAHIRRLQRMLNIVRNPAKAAHQPVLVVDGIFGKQTEKRVNQFKRHHGLPADGIAGPNMGRKLIAAVAERR